MRKIAFTSIALNYLPKARALAHSIKRHAKDVSFVLLVAEDIDTSLLRPDDPFDAFLTIKELGLPNLERWLFFHTVVEVCTAIKGAAMLKLLDLDEDCVVLYFDPDIILTSSLDSLFANFDDGASILLTPHVIEPATTLDEILDNEISPLRHGVYNLGFLGVRNSSAGLRFADWWAKRLYDFCYDDISNGIFTDQRWVDLAPAMFEGVRILRNPGYNVATWNLAHRVVNGSIEEGFSVNGCSLVFYHFSGFDSGAQEIMLEKYGHQSPVLKDLREWYINECRRLGQDQIGTLSWNYSKFDNGQPITNGQRKLYRGREDLQRTFPNPFSTQHPSQSFFHWYLHNSQQPKTPVVPRESTCRILVLAFDEGPDFVQSLQDLVDKTARQSDIRVVATRSILERLQYAVPELRFIEISDTDASAEQRESWILNQIMESQESGLIFVQLGLRVPALWDLRLQWNAAREPEVVTVSPMYNGAPMTSPLEPGEASLAANPEDIDLAVLNPEHRIPIDAPTLLYECFYVKSVNAREIARRLLERYPRKRQRPWLVEFARQCVNDGFSHVISTNVYVGANPSTGHRDLVGRMPDADVVTYLRKDVLNPIRMRLKDSVKSDWSRFPGVSQQASRRHLHVMHSWGGGLEHWVESFCRSDDEHVNMVLKPNGHVGALGNVLQLYASIGDPGPVAEWSLPIQFKVTVPSNLSYQRIINGIVKDYGIDVVFVSSLIGHSMDVLKTEATTVLICHDHFPLSPEIYVRAGDLAGNRVSDFSVDKVYEHGSIPLFPNYSRSEAKLADKAFRKILAKRIIKLVAPSYSARRIYLDLATELNPRDITVIPNGTAPNILSAPLVSYQSGGKLRIVVPGRMTSEKGQALLARVVSELADFAHVLLLGCGIEGLYFANTPGVWAITEYEHNRLPELVEEFKPHVGLFLSNVPETFSYTLDELLSLGIPPVAVRIGNLADRITEGLNGFLIDNSPDSLLDMLKSLDQDRTRLESVRKTLEALRHRTEAEMIRDYEELLGLPRYSERALNAKPLPLSAYKNVRSKMNAHAELAESPQRGIQASHGSPEHEPLVRDEIEHYAGVSQESSARARVLQPAHAEAMKESIHEESNFLSNEHVEQFPGVLPDSNESKCVTPQDSIIVERQRATCLANQITRLRELLKDSESARVELTTSHALLESLIVETEQARQAASAQLAATQSSLASMTTTLAWRLASRFGKIKYAYFLPLYRIFGLPYRANPERNGDSEEDRRK